MSLRGVNEMNDEAISDEIIEKRLLPKRNGKITYVLIISQYNISKNHQFQTGGFFVFYIIVIVTLFQQFIQFLSCRYSDITGSFS